jgi:hypothetical protein
MALPIEANSNAVTSFEILFLCIQCNNFSEDLNNCRHCGNIDLNGVEVQIVSDETVQEVVENVDESKEAKSIEVEHKMRKREINCYGMFLKEQQEINGNSSKKLDIETMSVKWKGLSETEKAKYKQQSLEDREFLKTQSSSAPIKGKKRKNLVEPVDVEMKKKLRNKKDSEVKAQKREEIVELKQDVSCSKNILAGMIAEKIETLAKYIQEVETDAIELESISKEILVSEKLVKNKKETLAMYKKEYKELYECK